MPVDLQLLEQTPTFHALNPKQLDALARILKYRHFHAGDTIHVQGAPGKTMCFIEKGEVILYTLDAKGEDKVFRTLKPGGFFGEVALFDRGVRSAHAKAKTEVFAWELHRDDLQAFFAACPDMAVAMVKEMAHRLDTSAAMLHDTITPSAAQQIDASRTATEKEIAQLVRYIGGLPFLHANIVGCLMWIVINRPLPRPWDSPGFGYLALFLSFEALVVTVLVLAKQNRDEKDANLRNDTIMSKIQTTPQEIQHLRQSLRTLTELIHAERHERTHPPR